MGVRHSSRLCFDIQIQCLTGAVAYFYNVRYPSPENRCLSQGGHMRLQVRREVVESGLARLFVACLRPIGIV